MCVCVTDWVLVRSDVCAHVSAFVCVCDYMCMCVHADVYLVLCGCSNPPLLFSLPPSLPSSLPPSVSSMALYDYRMKGDALLSWPSPHNGQGLTALRLSYDGRLLFSGARKNDYVHCWDLRKGSLLSSFWRDASSNQRLGIDLDPAGRYLATGTREGGKEGKNGALVYDLSTGQEVGGLGPVEDTTSDVSFHPYAGLVAVGMGERHFDEMNEEEEGGEEEAMVVEKETARRQSGVRLFQVPLAGGRRGEVGKEGEGEE